MGRTFCMFSPVAGEPRIRGRCICGSLFLGAGRYVWALHPCGTKPTPVLSTPRPEGR